MTMHVGSALFLASLVPLAFLVYSLTHLKKLGIRPSHPRIIVEAALFTLCLVLAFVLR